MIQITQSGVVISDAESISQLKDSFKQQNCIVLPRLFELNLLMKICERIKTAKFYSNVHKDFQEQEFATDLTICENELALHQIHFALNNTKLFEVIERITGCPSIGSFSGRIYRNQPKTKHQLEWHDDTDSKYRLIGISINLSEEHYEGGVFQLRERKTERIIFEKSCGNFGDAHIFLISSELQHRVTRVEGHKARTAAAGWFYSQPRIDEALNKLFDSNKTNSLHIIN